MFDVIIPTKNRPDDIARLLNSIVEQSKKPNKVIIIDQTEKKININPTFLKILNIDHIHNSSLSGLCAAKNFGVQKSTSEYIFFFDDDIILKKHFFENIINHFKCNDKIVGICGRQVNSKSSRFKLLFFSLFHRGPFKDERKRYNSCNSKDDLIITNILPGGITAYKKSVFNTFHFDEVLIKYCLGEDMDFSYRVGQNNKLAFATNAEAIHNHSKIDRYDFVEQYACKLAGYDYFFKKNINCNLKNKFYYNLVKIGVYFDAIYFFIRHLSFDSFKGLSKGKKYIKNDYKDVPFIDYNKYIKEYKSKLEVKNE